MRKIPSVFKRDWHQDVPAQEQIQPNCQWVFDPYVPVVPTRKFDGTCCFVWKRQFYKRRSVGPDENPPAGFILDNVIRGVPNLMAVDDKHGWVPVDSGDPNDQYHMEGLKNTVRDYEYDVLPDGTYELVGPKIQGNPHNLVEHELRRHGSVIEREFIVPQFRRLSNPHATVAHYLRTHEIEGIIFHELNGNRAAKVKRTDFGLEWPVED